MSAVGVRVCECRTYPGERSLLPRRRPPSSFRVLRPPRGFARYRVLLNSGISGPQAFMMLAQDRGYLREAGVDVEFVAGDGAAAVVPRVLPEGFDFGYGDITALDRARRAYGWRGSPRRLHGVQHHAADDCRRREWPDS